MTGEHELNRDVDIDLGGIFGSIWRHKFKIVLASLIVTAIAFVVLQVISPRYRSEARILIQASDPVLSNPDTSVQRSQPSFDDQAIASQVQLLKSRTIARKIIEEMNLKELPEFDYALEKSRLRQLIAALGLQEGGLGVTAEDRVLETYYDRLKVFQAEEARVIVVQFWSKKPELAAEIPNRITDEYMRLQEELKRGAAPEELKKLEPELDGLRKRVMQAEAAVADFRQNSDLLQGSNNETLATQDLSELSTELGRVRAQLSRAEANAAAVSRALESGALETASSVLESPLIQRLRERQVNLQSDLAEQSTTLLPGHPRIQRLQSQIRTLDSQISREGRKIQSSLQQDARVARAREQDLIQRRNALKAEAGRVGKEQVELRALEREADAQRQLLNAYLVRFKEAKSRQDRQFLPADAFVFSKAQTQSKPYFPKKLPTLAGAFFGTLVLGSMLTLAGSVLSSNAASGAAGARNAALRNPGSFLNETPQVPAKKSEPLQSGASEKPDQPSTVNIDDLPSLAPSLSELTETVIPDDSPPEVTEIPGFASAEIAARSIMVLGRARIAVLSPEGDEGARGTIVLARFLAQHGSSVVLVDMTGSGSTTQSMLGRNDLAGLKDLLAEQATFSQVIHTDELTSAHIVPMGMATATQASQGAFRISSVLEALQHSYDFVIVDCGAADINGLSRVSDVSTVVIVNAVDPGNGIAVRTSREMMEAGLREPLMLYSNGREMQLMGFEAA